MTNPVIVYRQEENGRVAICTPVLTSGLSVEQIAEKDVPQGAQKRICEASCIPQESAFFGAWIYDGGVENAPISIDVSAAHEIWKEEWRRTRTPILARLDVEWMRALEQGNTTLSQELAAKKQTLRDVTQTPLPQRQPGETVDHFSARVKAVWPECLTW
jgi:hypothetical protein